MSKLICIYCFLIVTACVNPAQRSFLKSETIPLATPHLSSTSFIIDSTVILEAKLKLDGAVIHYTTDGTIPTENSLLYKNPLIVNKGGVYNFKAFHSNWLPSEVTSLQLYEKGVIPTICFWNTNANKKYRGQGESSLTNGVMANSNFTDNQWMGFDTLAKATFQFDYEPFIKSISIGYLIDTKAWIFPPESVTLLLNRKDTMYFDLTKIKTTGSPSSASATFSIQKKIEIIEISVQNLTKIPEGHSGFGNKAWLFMDEWIFNE